MYLVNWKPHVYRSQMGRVALAFAANLKCPICNAETERETSGHLFHNLNGGGLQENIRWEIDDLKQRKNCQGCGVVSVLPLSDLASLDAEAKHLITREWAEKEINSVCPGALKFCY